MSDDYKIQNAYEGGECHVLKSDVRQEYEFTDTKPKYNLVFQNAEGDQVGILDFNGPGLSFEGVADLSAITFMDWVSKYFQARLEEEYQRGFNEGKKS